MPSVIDPNIKILPPVKPVSQSIILNCFRYNQGNCQYYKRVNEALLIKIRAGILMGGEILKWLTTPCVCFVKEAHVHTWRSMVEAGTQLKLFSLF